MFFDKSKNYYDITLALAGIFQAILLIKNLAKTGKADEAAFSSSINTIYKMTSETTEAIYNGPEGVYVGLKEVVNFFDIEKKRQDADIARYLLGLIYLEKKLSRNEKMQDALAQRISSAINQTRFFPPAHPTLVSNLAEAYSQTLGSLPYRISIVGRASYLHRPDVMDKIRALLLAGIRSTVLWRQTGGTRWGLIFGRKRIPEIAAELCQKCQKKSQFEP